jgi:hypothetical protein
MEGFGGYSIERICQWISIEIRYRYDKFFISIFGGLKITSVFGKSDFEEK